MDAGVGAPSSTKRAEKFGKQYDQYEPIPGTKINGKLTMGENIGDLGGLEMAYAAYKRYVAAAWRAAGDRRPDRRSALLHRLRPDVALEDHAKARCASGC